MTYGFPTSSSDYGSGEGGDAVGGGVTALNGVQRSAVVTTLNAVSNVTNLAFTLAGTPGSAQMRYALSGEPDTAYAYYPGSGDGGDSWYNRTRYTSPTVGNYAWMTFIHETGHALGLKHGHESPALSPDRDSIEYSVMTYRGYIGADPGGSGYSNESFGFAQTLMMYDIAALQRMYGADFTYNAGDTVYSWSPQTGAFSINGATQWTPGANRVFMTLWDGGGNDTYNLSAYTGSVTIDLRPGEWVFTSDVQLANLGGGNMARANVANALLHQGDTRSLIDNAIGGPAADTLVANQVQNDLTGGGGADIFRFTSVEQSRPGLFADILTDFVSGADDIDLSQIDANSGAGGDQAFSFIGTSAFTGVAGQLRYDVIAGSTHIFADVDGNLIADLQIVANSPVLTASDFIL